MIKKGSVVTGEREEERRVTNKESRIIERKRREKRWHKKDKDD